MKRRLLVILLVLAMLAGIVGGITWWIGRQQGKRLLTRAEVARKAGLYDKAIALANQYIAGHPNDWEGHYQKGKALSQCGRFGEAREPLKRATELAPEQVLAAVALAETYAVPAAQSLSNVEARGQAAGTAEVISRALPMFVEARKILDAVPTPNDETKLDLLQYRGLNLVQLGQAHRMLADRLAADAEIAAASRNADIAADKQRESGEAASEAQLAYQEAIGMLTTVVKADPKRDAAAEPLVRACLDTRDEIHLAAAREIIMGSEAPPPGAATLLAIHDLGEFTKEADIHSVRAQIEQTAKFLDGILEKHPKHLEARLARLELALELRDTATAQRLCDELLREGTVNPRAQLLQAKLLEAQGRFAEAERAMFMLKTKHPTWVPGQLAYAQAALDSGYIESAKETLRKVVKLDPKNRYARRFLAEYLLRHGYHSEAFDDAREYYRAFPDDALALRLFAEAASQTHEETAAREALKTAKTQYASSAEMLVAAAGGYALLGENDEARSLAQKAAEIKPTNSRERIAVGRALVVLGKLVEAENLFQAELKRRPDQPRVAFELGKLYTATGRPLQALEQYRAAVRLDRHSVPFRLALARALLDVGDYDQAEKTLEGMHPSNASANLIRLQVQVFRGQNVDVAETLQQVQKAEQSGLALAVTLLHQGQTRQCVEVCRAELDRRPEDLEARTLLGTAQLKLGEVDACVEQWAAVLERAPERFSMYLRLAGALLPQQEPEQVAQRLLAIRGANEDMVELTKGWMYVGARQPQRAEFILRQLVAKEGVSDFARGRAMILRARCLAQLGQPDEAEAELRRLAKNAEWRGRAQLARAGLLIAMRRRQGAEAALAELCEGALADQNVSLLQEAVPLWLRVGRTDRAIEVCEHLRRLAPYDLTAYTLTAAAYRAQGDLEATAKWLREAIIRQPGSTSPHIMLARTLDLQGDAEGALTVLDDLAKLADDGRAAGSAKTAALFEKGQMLARWGLQRQAADQFAALKALGYGKSPALQLATGEALFALGEQEQSREALAGITEQTPQYVRAQKLLAAMAPTLDQKLAILRALAKANPGQVSVSASLQEMTALLLSERPEEAIEVFRSFEADGQTAVPSVAAHLALGAMIEAGDLKGAADLARRTYKRLGGARWRGLAVLLTADEDVEAAGKLLSTADRPRLADVLLAMVLAGRNADPAVARGSLEGMDKLAAQWTDSGRLGRLSPQYTFLAAMIAGDIDRARKDLELMKREGIIVQRASEELLASATRGEAARAEAVRLLQASLAMEMQLMTLARRWATDVLTERPTCQFAAAIIFHRGVDKDEAPKVLKLLQPTDCTIARLVRATLLVGEQKYADAAAAYANAAVQERGSTEILMLQAHAERLGGNFAKAAELYDYVWQRAKVPEAANNRAYLTAILHPADRQRLSQALEDCLAAIKAEPRRADYRDTRGWLEHLLGNDDLAVRELRKVVKAMPDSPEAHCHLGLAEAAAGKAQMARWHLSAAMMHGERLKAEGRLNPEMAKAVELARQALAGLPGSES